MYQASQIPELTPSTQRAMLAQLGKAYSTITGELACAKSEAERFRLFNGNRKRDGTKKTYAGPAVLSLETARLREGSKQLLKGLVARKRET